MENSFSVVVLISGRGSNMMSLVENARNYRVMAVLSDREDAAGLAWAKERGIITQAFPRSNYASRKEQRSGIYQKIREINPDLVCLAGFMQIVDEDFVREYFGRLINIHPALLPKFPGLHTHERALEAAEKLHGCTVHFVDSGVDTGPIIAQASCEICEHDTADLLAARVLKHEHRIYPEVVSNIASGKIKLEGRTVKFL